MRKIYILSFLTILASITVPPLQAQTNSDPIKTEQKCQKPIKARGPGNTLASVAELKAIIIWLEKVTKAHNAEHANWHNAKSKSVKCKKQPKSSYFYCELRATPCIHQLVPKETEETADKTEKQQPQDTTTSQ